MFVNTENSESMVSNRSLFFESVKGNNGERSELTTPQKNQLLPAQGLVIRLEE